MNCIIVDDDKISREIVEHFIKKISFLHLSYSFQTAVEAIKTLKSEEEINLIFLDIQMPEMSGIELLDSLQSYPQVIIVSAQEHYALEAFNYDVTDYLLKPITYPRFLKAVNKAYDRYKETPNLSETTDGIFIRRNSSLIRLKYNDIIWIEALENYVTFTTETEKIIVHSTMTAIESKLPCSKFSRVHRSFIVNLSKFDIIEDNSIMLKIGDQTKIIPIGKSYKGKLLSDLNLLNC